MGLTFLPPSLFSLEGTTRRFSSWDSFCPTKPVKRVVGLSMIAPPPRFPNDRVATAVQCLDHGGDQSY